MNVLQRATAAVVLTAMGIGSIGCAAQRDWMANNGAIVGSVGGAALGAGAGALLDDDNRGRGALIGAGVGAVAGAGLGYMVQKQHKQLQRIKELEVRQARVEVEQAAQGQEIQRIQRQALVVTVPGEVLFEKASASLSSHGYSKVAEVAQVLREDPTGIVQIRGYASSEGDPGFNLRLSQDRAEAVAAALAANGVPRTRIPVVVGMGIENPVASNATESGRAQNRRVEITIIPSEG